MERKEAHKTKAKNTRIFMVVENSDFLNRLESNQYSIFTQKFHHSVTKTLKQFEGLIINQDNNSYLVSFKSATNAVLCALQIEQKFKYVTPKFDTGNRRLKIGLSTAHTEEDGNAGDQGIEFIVDTRVVVAEDQEHDQYGREADCDGKATAQQDSCDDGKRSHFLIFHLV